MPTARTVFYLVAAFYIMTAAPSLVTAAPTTISSTSAIITTSPAGMNGNPAVITFNQSQCLDPTNAASQVNEAKDSLCYGHFLAVGVIGNALKVSNYHHNNNNNIDMIQVHTILNTTPASQCTDQLLVCVIIGWQVACMHWCINRQIVTFPVFIPEYYG